MGVDRFNSEGYSDPISYEAISHIEREWRKWRPLVYICSPYAGDISGNTQRARRFSRFAVDSGTIPLAPHLLLPQYISEAAERELAMHMNMVLWGKCEELWVFGGDITEGMEMEISKAKKRRMQIRYFTEDLEEQI